MCKICLPKLSKRWNEPWPNKWENPHKKMLQVDYIPREKTFHVTEYRQCAAFHFILDMFPVVLSTPSYVPGPMYVCIALNGSKIVVVLVLLIYCWETGFTDG